jgi:hypothetical protein
MLLFVLGKQVVDKSQVDVETGVAMCIKAICGKPVPFLSTG